MKVRHIISRIKSMAYDSYGEIKGAVESVDSEKNHIVDAGNHTFQSRAVYLRVFAFAFQMREKYICIHCVSFAESGKIHASSSGSVIEEAVRKLVVCRG